jgi:hypothetical protein
MQMKKGRLPNPIRIPNLNREKQSAPTGSQGKRLTSMLQNNSPNKPCQTIDVHFIVVTFALRLPEDEWRLY